MANSLYQWFMVGIVAALHPFFVSVIELNHNPKEKSVEISMRIFVDDFEATLKKFGNTKIDVAKPEDKAALDKLIVNYINQKIQISIDAKKVAMHYVGYEIKQESVWLYFEIDNINTIKKIDVNSNLLYEYQDKQINIFRVKANGVEKSYKLDYPKTFTSFEM